MKGFKDTTRTKYMCGGPVKKFAGGMMEEGDMTPSGVAPKKAKPKGMGQMTDREMQMLKEGAKKPSTAAGALAGALAGAGVRAGARAAGKAMQMAREATPRGAGTVSDRDVQMAREAMKKAVPAHSSKPMIGRKTGGLMAMPKGKCK